MRPVVVVFCFGLASEAARGDEAMLKRKVQRSISAAGLNLSDHQDLPRHQHNSGSREERLKRTSHCRKPPTKFPNSGASYSASLPQAKSLIGDNGGP